MREIKFRGYLKKENKMFPVSDLNFNGVDQWAVGLSSCGRLDCGLCEEHHERADVVVMQFTGSKDKNGREIYEGDMLQSIYDETYVSVVSYSVDGVGSCGCCYDSFEGAGFVAKELKFKESIIIGNIYENPELLGDKKEEKQ